MGCRFSFVLAWVYCIVYGFSSGFNFDFLSSSQETDWEELLRYLVSMGKLNINLIDQSSRETVDLVGSLEPKLLVNDFIFLHRTVMFGVLTVGIAAV